MGPPKVCAPVSVLIMSAREKDQRIVWPTIKSTSVTFQCHHLISLSEKNIPLRAWGIKTTLRKLCIKKGPLAVIVVLLMRKILAIHLNWLICQILHIHQIKWDVNIFQVQIPRNFRMLNLTGLQYTGTQPKELI